MSIPKLKKSKSFCKSDFTPFKPTFFNLFYFYHLKDLECKMIM